MSRFPLLLACLLLVGCSSQEFVSADEKPPENLATRRTGHDWPGFLGPTGDSVSTETGILTNWPKNGPPLVWSKSIGAGYATVSVSRGRVFLFDRMRNKQRLRAMNAETGEELWTFEYATDYRDQYGYSGGPRCFPVIDDDRVYVLGPEGMLYCVRVKDGKAVWKLNILEEFGVIPNFFGVGSTPVVEGDMLIVQVGGSPKGSDRVRFDELKGNGTGVVAFDKLTGKIKWKASDELASYASPIVRTIGKRKYCFVFARGGLVALDPSNGKVDFTHPWRSELFESANASNPVVVDDKIFISECYEIGGALLKVKPNGVEEVWTDKDKGRKKSLACHWMTPIHVDGYLYGSSGRHEGEAELRCVELATGKVMWSEKALTRSSLLLVDGHFVCLGEDGALRLLKVNPRKYEEIAVARPKPIKDGRPDENAEPLLEDPCWAAPVLSHGLMYLRGRDKLVCMELIPQKKN